MGWGTRVLSWRQNLTGVTRGRYGPLRLDVATVPRVDAPAAGPDGRIAEAPSFLDSPGFPSYAVSAGSGVRHVGVKG